MLSGLLVAVPAVMLYNHFVRRIAVMLTIAENHGRSLRLALEDARRANGTAMRGGHDTPDAERVLTRAAA